MARKPRGPVPAGVYHVWRRTNGPVQMFRNDFDRSDFCRRLTRTITRHGWTCTAYVLMTTHFHFVLAVDDDTLSAGMHDFFGPYAQEFNRRHGRYGHLRGEPFKLRPVFGDAAVRRVVKYVANNPVEAGLCELPQDWYWSSYAGSAGYRPQFPFVDDSLLLGGIHSDVAQARMLLRDIAEPTPNVRGTVPLTFVA